MASDVPVFYDTDGLLNPLQCVDMMKYLGVTWLPEQPDMIAEAVEVVDIGITSVVGIFLEVSHDS